MVLLQFGLWPKMSESLYTEENYKKTALKYVIFPNYFGAILWYRKHLMLWQQSKNKAGSIGFYFIFLTELTTGCFLSWPSPHPPPLLCIDRKRLVPYQCQRTCTAQSGARDVAIIWHLGVMHRRGWCSPSPHLFWNIRILRARRLTGSELTMMFWTETTEQG